MIEEVIHSPHAIGALFAITFIGGFYARGGSASALVFGLFAPFLVIAVWFMAMFVASLPIGLLNDHFTGVVDYLSASDSWYGAVLTVAMNPYWFATIVAGLLFAFFCHYERINGEVRGGGRRFVGGRAARSVDCRYPGASRSPMVRKPYR